MKCPKCGSSLRPSKKYPGYYLCDTCLKRYASSSVIKIDSQKQVKKPKKKRKNPFIKFLFLLLLCVCVFIGLYAFGVISFEDPATPQSKKINQYSSTESAVLGDITVSIKSVQSSSGTDFIKPSKGNIFLLIEVMLENTSDLAHNVNGIYDFSLIQADTIIPYSADSYKILSESQQRVATVIEPKEAISGFLCYEIPSDWNSLYLQYSSPTWSFQKIQFEIHNSNP